MTEIQDNPTPEERLTARDRALLEWWKRLQGLTGEDPRQLEAGPPQAGMAGERSELKRATTAVEVVFAPAYQRLRLALLQAGEDAGYREETWVAVARVLVRIKAADLTPSIAARMGSPADKGGDKPRISELRFKRLLRTESPWELADQLIRLLPMLEHKANPVALARDVAFWNENTRKRWANEYYQAWLNPTH